ncbi:Feruloyl esterase B [Paramyrothecium foliicola]|nr:Feruloyl esterase B [Paramyrothecium foliicola]
MEHRLRGSLHALLLASSGIFYPAQPVTASLGCGKEPNFTGETRRFAIQSDGRAREYSVHLPKNYKVDDVQPLLVAYHGRGNNPEEFEIATRFSDEAVNSKMIVAYPAGVEGKWEGASYAEPGVSDQVFTTDLVSKIKDEFCVDESRIYATGFSNGGGFVNTLACSAEHGREFAAFASHAAALYTDVAGDENCQPSRSPIPILEFHGLEDVVIPYGGGEGKGGPLPALPEWLSRWARRNACSGSGSSGLPVGGQHTKWNCGGIDGALQHYNTTKLFHGWPAAGAELDISPIIMEFLSAQVKPS